MTRKTIDSNPGRRPKIGLALGSIFEVLLALINIMEIRITQTRLGMDRPDIIIQPRLRYIRFVEFGHVEEIIVIGYEHTQRQLAQIGVGGLYGEQAQDDEKRTERDRKKTS